MKTIKLLNVSGKGHLIFKDEFSVDVPDVGLVCVYGPNGSGKTSFVDFVPLSIWGITENRFADNKKSVIYHQFSEIGYAETTWQVGTDVVKIRRNVNPKSRVQKRMIWVNNVQEPEADKDTTFNLTIAKYFGDNFTKETFLATAYTTQKSVGNILHVSVEERRKTTDQIFGLTEFQEPFQKVSDFVKARNEELEALRKNVSRIGDGKALIAAKKEYIEIVEDSKAKLESLQEETITLATQIDVKSDSLRIQENANTDTASLLAQQAETKASKAKLVAELNTNNAKKSTLTGLTGRLASVEKAKLVVPELEIEKEKNEASLLTLQQEYDSAAATRKQEIETLNTAKLTLLTAQEDAEKEYNTKSKAKTDLENRIRTAKQSKEGRDKTSALLADVGCATPEFEVAANNCKLLTDARTAKADSAALITIITTLEEEILKIVVDDSVVKEAKAAVAENQKAMNALITDTKFSVLGQDVQKLKDVIADLVRSITQGKQVLASEEEILAARKQLELINSGILDLELEIAKLDSFLLVTETQLKGFEEAAQLLQKTRNEITAAENRITVVKKETEGTQKNITVKEIEINQIDDKLIELGELLKTEKELLETLDLANEIKIAYSPTGARALIVDAMSPQLSETINELLREYYGDEFLVEFRTVKTLQNGNQEECYDIMVHDKKPGVPVSTANNKSPGQQGILTEVVGLGVLIEAYRRSGLALKTIIRDEATAAMDSANAEKYLSMLLRARELTNIDTIMYITHNPVLAMRADAYIVVGNGKIEVRKEMEISE